MNTRFALCTVLLAALFGCGREQRVSLRGEVALDGRPLKQGSIQFVPLPGTDGPTAGADIVDGKFTVPSSGGPFAGDYRVLITAAGPTGRKILDVRSNAMVDEYAQILPARYNTHSELRAEISAGRNRLQFELHSTDPPATN